MKVAVVGAGNLGRAIIKNAARKVEVVAVKRRPEKLENAEVTTKIEDIGDADLVLIALKPDVFRRNIKRIGELAGDTPVVSFAAGVKLAEMVKYIRHPHRAMTDLAIERRSLVACYPPETMKLLSFLDAEFLECESEDELDAMTAYIGSSPAILSYLLHAMVLAALKDGIRYRKGIRIASHAFRSAAWLYENYGLERVTEMVATPGGTTAEGILNLRPAEKVLMDAMLSTSARARGI